MIGQDSAPTVYDVTFVVEGTANVGAYFETIKSSYILPSLEYFNGGPPEDVDYGCSYSCSLYSLITYHSADSIPGLAASCNRPTTSTRNFINQLDNIEFSGGFGDSSSLMSEGLSTALQLFDDLDQIREPNIRTQKHCILVCNSNPCPKPSQECLTYTGLFPNQLVEQVNKKGINFSIISPRKLPSLFQLFEKGSGELNLALMKNYATDSRHLVLLKGYSLQECPASPSLKKEEEIKALPIPNASLGISSQPSTVSATSSQLSSSITTTTSQSLPASSMRTINQPEITVPNTAAKEAANQILHEAMVQFTKRGPQSKMTTQQPGVATSQQQQQQQTVSSQPNMQPPVSSNFPQNPSGASSMPNMMNPQQATPPMANSQNVGLASQPGASQAMVSQPMVSQPIGSLTTMGSQGIATQGLGGPVMVSQQTAMAGQSSAAASLPSQPMPGDSNVLSIEPGNQLGGGNLLSNVDLNNPIASMQKGAAAQMAQRRIIWTGALEWQDKGKNAQGQETKFTRSLPCQVFTTQAEQDLNTSKWPAKLLMQLIPSSFLQHMQNLFRSPRTVGFNFSATNDPETTRHLYQAIVRGLVGCINFNVAQCDVKVLMLLFSKRNKQFMGLIPNDQAAFIATFRTMIERTKRSRIPRMPNDPQANAAAAAPGGSGGVNPGMPVVTATQQTQQMGMGPMFQVTMPGGHMQQPQQQPLTTMSQPNQPQPQPQPPQPQQLQPRPTLPGNPGGAATDTERRANLKKIRELQEILNDAQQRELKFQEEQNKKKADAIQQQQQQQQIIGMDRRRQVQQQQQNMSASGMAPVGQNQPQIPVGPTGPMGSQATTTQQLKNLLLNQQQQQQQLRHQQQHMLMQQRPRGPGPQPGQPMMQPMQAPLGLPVGSVNMQASGNMAPQTNQTQSTQPFLSDDFNIPDMGL